MRDDALVIDAPGHEGTCAGGLDSASNPSSMSTSRLIKSGLPANAENDWYGESP